MMTIEEALAVLDPGSGWIPSRVEAEEARESVRTFAQDMHRMLEGLGLVSFPIPGHLRITLDPDEPHDAVYITEVTARRIHAILGEALAVQS